MFLIKLVLSKLRSEGKITLAATLLHPEPLQHCYSTEKFCILYFKYQYISIVGLYELHEL